MPTRFYVPGPSGIYVGVGGGGAFVQLGFTERSARVTTVPKHRGVAADYAGDMDADAQFMGEEAYISLRLSRFNETVLQLCRKRLNNDFAVTPGAGFSGAIGSLMVQEGNVFQVVIVSQYSKLANTGDMVPGIRLLNAYMADSDEKELGMEVKTPTVVFRTIANFGTDGSYVLYTENDVNSLSLPTLG